MNRALVLVTFKIVESRGRRLGDAWLAEFRESPSLAYGQMGSFLAYGVPFLEMLALLIASPLLMQSQLSYVGRGVELLLITFPLVCAAIGFIEVSSKSRGAPDFIMGYPPDQRRRLMDEIDLPANYHVLLLGSLVGLVVSLVLAALGAALDPFGQA